MHVARAPRRLKVMTAVGAWGDPTAGIAPGRPAATFVMSMVLELWRRGLANVQP